MEGTTGADKAARNGSPIGHWVWRSQTPWCATLSAVCELGVERSQRIDAPPTMLKVLHSRAKTDDEIATRRMNRLSFSTRRSMNNNVETQATARSLTLLTHVGKTT
jgi:hypothetical protein